jgi:hypothetical protein
VFLLAVFISLVSSGGTASYVTLLISCLAAATSGVIFARGSNLYQAKLGTLIGYFSAVPFFLFFIAALINSDIAGTIMRVPELLGLLILWIVMWFVLLKATLNTARISPKATQQAASVASGDLAL